MRMRDTVRVPHVGQYFLSFTGWNINIRWGKRPSLASSENIVSSLLKLSFSISPPTACGYEAMSCVLTCWSFILRIIYKALLVIPPVWKKNINETKVLLRKGCYNPIRTKRYNHYMIKKATYFKGPYYKHFHIFIFYPGLQWSICAWLWTKKKKKLSPLFTTSCKNAGF